MPTFTSLEEDFAPIQARTMTGSIGQNESPVSAGIPEEMQQAIGEKIYNRINSRNVGMSTAEYATRWMGGTAIDLVDTVVGNKYIPGTQRGDVWSLFDDTEEKDFLEANRPLIEGSSAITGSLLVGVAGASVVLPRLAKALSSSTFLTSTRLWQSGSKYNTATRAAMLQAQRSAAASGTPYRLLGNAAGRRFLGLEVAKGVGVGAAEEALIYGAMNANEALYTGDLATDLFWSALGPVAGGAIYGISARAYSRQVANSDAIRDIRAKVHDPAGASNDLVAGVPLDRVGAGVERLKESARFTEYMVGARATTPEGAPLNIDSKMHYTRAQFDDLANDSLQKMVNSGIDGVPVLTGKITAARELVSFKAAAKDDPFLAHGLDRIGMPRDSIDASMESRKEFIKALDEKKEHKLARQLEEQEPFLFFNGRFNEASSPQAKAVADFNPDGIQIQKTKTGASVTVPLKGGSTRISENFLIGGGKGKKFSELHVTDQLKVLEGTKHVMAGMLKQKSGLTLPKNSNWFQIDAAIEFSKNGGKVDWSKAGFNNPEEAMLHSLKLKADELLTKRGVTGPISEWDRLAYNLPGGTAFERMEDSAGDTLREWLRSVYAYTDPANKTGAIVAVKELAESLQKARTIQGYDLMPAGGKGTQDSGRITGNFFSWNRDESGKWLKPLLGFFDPASEVKPLTKAGVAEQLVERKIGVINSLRSGEKSKGFVRTVTDTLLSIPETKMAMNILGLSDEQITGLGHSMSRIAGEGLTQRMRFRDSPVMLAVTRVQEIVHRLSNARIESLFRDSGLSETLVKVNGSGQQSSKALLNQFFSHKAGWDLDEVPVNMKGGFFGFQLADTPKNRARLGVDEVAEGTMLTNPRTGKEIVLDDLGLSTLEQWVKVTDELLIDRNRIRAAHGLKPVERTSFYTPPPNLEGKHVAFVFDEFNQPVAGWTLIADSEQAYKELYKRTEKELIDEYGAGHGYTVRDSNALAATKDIYDEAAMDWVDPGFSLARADRQRGTLTGRFVNPRAFDDALEWAKRQTLSQGHDVIRSIFSEQLQVARLNSAVDKLAKQVPGERLDKYRNIYDEYEMALLGKQAAYSESAMTGKAFRAAEDFFNKIVADRPQMSGRWLADLFGRVGVPVGKAGALKSYAQMVNVLGEHTPFKHAMDYAESQLQIQRPADVRKWAQRMNRLSAAMILRYFELPHAMLNLTGIMATMPALVRGGQSPITVGFKLKGGARVGVPDSGRILVGAMQDMISGRHSANEDWLQMVKMGDAKQDVADFHIQLGVIDNKNKFMKVMAGTGNPNDSMPKRLGIDGMLSVATDKTEDWSRQYAHFVGLRLARYHGIAEVGARNEFAREIANAAIADYSPANRPELFQTAFGSLYGTFMSYVFNQNQKMFRWLEQKQFQEFGMHLSMQGALFGAVGVPGVKQLMSARDWFKETGSQEPTALDRIYAQFGPEVGAVLAHGGISAFGLAFHTRGDASIRNPSLATANPLENPGLKTIIGVTKVINNTIQATLDDYPDNVGEQLVQTLTREMPNRVLKGWLTVAQGGEEIDVYGNVAAETRTALDTAARLIGLRSTRQQAELEQYYASKSSADKDAARRDSLRVNIRNAIRKSQEHGTEVDWMRYFEKYVKSGGNPRHFRSWIKELIRDSGSSRAVKQLEKDLRSPNQQLRAWRFGAYGAGVN